MKNDEASSTALQVMQGILITANKDEYSYLVSEELESACRAILSSSPEGHTRLKQVESYWGRKSLALKEKLLMPGITLHYVLRKRYIEEYTINAIQRGTKQIVNLGAGFDTLLLRLSQKYPDVTFIEIDHPASQKIKLASLAKLEFDASRIDFIPVCFEKESFDEKLLSSSTFSKTAETLYILEGVLMYLSEQSTNNMFRSLLSLSGNAHKVIFTATESISTSPSSSSLLFKLYLMLKGEPLAWNCDKKDVDHFLKSINYRLIELVSAKEFKQQFLDKTFSGDLPDIEYIAIAEPNLTQ